MSYNTVLFIASGNDGSDAAALTKLCRSFVDAQKRIYLLYVGEHHVTGFGTMTARHHIANDMQIRQEVFPRLKQLCQGLAIPPERISIRFGNRARVIERFVREHRIDLLAVSGGLVAGNTSVIKLFTQLLEGSQCDLHIMP